MGRVFQEDRQFRVLPLNQEFHSAHPHLTKENNDWKNDRRPLLISFALILSSHQVILVFQVSLAVPYLQGIRVNRPFQGFQMWPPVHLQAGPLIQEFLEDHPSHLGHQNSVLEFLELQSHLSVQGNLWKTENTLPYKIKTGFQVSRYSKIINN